MTERQYYLWMRLIPDMGPRGHKKLLKVFGTAKGVYNADDKALCVPEIRTEGEKVLRFRKYDTGYGSAEERVLMYEERLRKQNIDYIAYNDADYPEQLKRIFDPPILLFYRGRKELLQSKRAIGIVGARNPSVYGKETAAFFAKELAGKEITIVSGLAAGIDAQSHKGAISAAGSTVGVLGSGINICYPACNYSLYEKMCREQLVISENGLDEPPLAFYFPLRNRIISGLSDGILVVEARRKSGSLITADAALEQGKDVYAVPGRAFDKLSEGTNHLIKMGAALADSPQDILENLFGEGMKERENLHETLTNALENELAPLEKIVYSGLSLEPVYIDDIISRSEGSVSDVLHILLSLEKRGLIKQPVKGYYIVSL